MHEEIDIQQMANVMLAISHYNGLANYFLQMDPNQREILLPYWEEMVKHSKDGKYMDAYSYVVWKDINVHMIKQMWGSTAGGWGGIGGSAMTSSYTIVIEPARGKAIFVYYGATLAYIARVDDKVKEFQANGYKRLPPYYNTKGLDIIYKNRNKR